MKRPYLNQEQRKDVLENTFIGAGFKIDIERRKLLREAKRKGGLIAMKREDRKIIELINERVFWTDICRNNLFKRIFTR